MSRGGEEAEGGTSAGDSAAGYDRVSDLFAALASPVRAAIVHRLTDRTHTVAELVDALGLSQPLVSHHLARLRHAGLVVGDRHGRSVAYRVADAHVAHVFLDALRHSTEAVPGGSGAVR